MGRFMDEFKDALSAAFFPNLHALNKKNREEQTWSKYSSSSDRDTGQPQTDYYEGYVGERNNRRKVHIAINDDGDIIYVRDIDGAVLYDRKRGIGHLPHDLNWSH